MTGENAPVREVPGFARVGQAARRAILGLTTPLFGTPEEPTKLGKAMDLVDEAASVGLMTYGASAARLGRAAERASLVARGARPQTVLRRTGYQRGPFGYGVETRGDATFRPSVVFDGGRGRAGTLGELAEVHPDVERAYPGFSETVKARVVPDSEWARRVAEAKERISAWSRGETSRGFFDRSGMEVNVRGKMPSETLEMYMDRADKTLSHELQHAAHEMDGIPPPKRGNFEWYRTDAREVDARNSANRNLLTPEERVEMPRANTQDVKPQDVHLADKGGDSPHKNFHNFLATDEVPETLFGFPVVQREGDYTEADLKFFKENPKAAGFYDMGDEEDAETQEAAGAGETAKDVHGLVQKFKDHVRTYENRRVEPYRDVDGNWAVGYGSHYLADGTKVTPKTAVTDRMIDDAFDADLARRIDLLAGHDRRQAKFAVPNWRYMSPESRLMLLDVSWGRKDTLTEKKSPGLFGELRAAGRDKAALDDAVRRHYPSYRKATDANGAVDESKTAGLQNRRIALLKALTGEDFSYDGKKWSTEKNEFVEE